MGHVEEEEDGRRDEERRDGRKDRVGEGKECYLAVSPLKQDSWQETTIERARQRASERASGRAKRG